MKRGFRIALLSAALFALGAPAAHATMSWNQGSHDYGSVNVGTPVSKTFTMTAMCDMENFMFPAQCSAPPSGLHIFGPPMVSGEGYAIGTPNTCSTGNLMTPTYPGMMTCQTAVVFTPASAGTKPGALSTSGPDITLTGTGVASPGSTETAPGSTETAKPKKKCKKKKGKKGAAAAKKKCGKKKK